MGLIPIPHAGVPPFVELALRVMSVLRGSGIAIPGEWTPFLPPGLGLMDPSMPPLWRSPSRLLTPAPRTGELDLCPPQLKEAFRRIGWTDGERGDLLNFLTDKVTRHVAPDQKAQFIDQAYQGLPLALEALQRAGLEGGEIFRFITLVAEKAGGLSTYALREIGPALEGMERTGWGAQRKYLFLTRLVERPELGLALHLALAFSGRAFANAPPEKACRTEDLIFRLLNRLNEHNQGAVLSLLRARSSFFDVLGPDHFPAHFEFSLTLFERWPALAFNLVEGVIEATQKGIVPFDLSPETRAAILNFISGTKGFLPTLFSKYLQEGEGLLARLKACREPVLQDRLGLPEVQEALQKEGEEFFLGVLQIATPGRGISKDSMALRRDHLRKALEAGDLRHHLPEGWRGREARILLRRRAWVLREDQADDPDEGVKGLFDRIRSLAAAPWGGEEAIQEALIDFLRSGRRPEARERLVGLLFRHGGGNSILAEKIQRAPDTGYRVLSLLDQLHQAIQKRLEGILDRLPKELFQAQGKKGKQLVHPEGLLKTLRRVWSGRRDSGTNFRLQGILAKLDPSEVEDRLLTREDLEPRFKETLRSLLPRVPLSSRRDVVSEILSDWPAEAIETEKAQYELRDMTPLPLTVRPVKGIGYALWGYNAAVCTRLDIEMWKDPRFLLLALIDEGKKEAAGVVELFESRLGGKKVVILPGINPSVELLDEVDAVELFGKIMETVKDFAEGSDYHRVLIPANTRIQSNLWEIQRAVQAARYPIRKIPPLRWSRHESTLVSEVYVAWEAPTPAAGNIQRVERLLAKLDFTPPALFRMEAFALDRIMAANARVLMGDADAIRGLGAYYVIEDESIGMNAGRDHFAINAYVDPRSGRIVAVGNLQSLPKEVIQGNAEVTFRIRVRSVREMLENRRLRDTIAEVIIRTKEIDPRVRPALRGLEGKPFEQLHPQEADFGDVLDGRRKRKPGPR